MIYETLELQLTRKPQIIQLPCIQTNTSLTKPLEKNNPKRHQYYYKGIRQNQRHCPHRKNIIKTKLIKALADNNNYKLINTYRDKT